MKIYLAVLGDYPDAFNYSRSFVNNYLESYWVLGGKKKEKIINLFNSISSRSPLGDGVYQESGNLNEIEKGIIRDLDEGSFRKKGRFLF